LRKAAIQTPRRKILGVARRVDGQARRERRTGAE